MSFDLFWSVYPRHVAKGAALKAWTKLEPDEEMTKRIMLAVQAQKTYRRKIEDLNETLPERQKKFIPDWKHPATWLNQACWDDEIPSLAATKLEIKPIEICDCGAPTFNRVQCPRCYSKQADPTMLDRMKEHLRNMGFSRNPGESWREASIRCLKANALSLPEFGK